MINRFITKVAITAVFTFLLAQPALSMQGYRDGMTTPPPTEPEQRTIAAGKLPVDAPFTSYQKFLASLGQEEGTSLTPDQVSQRFQAMLRQKNVK